MPTPSTWQTSSVALKRASDPNALSRVSGLEFGLRAPAGAWPILTVRGGVRAATGNLLVPVANVAGADFLQSFRTISVSDLGAISVPGQSVPSITETSDWSFIKLAYASQFDATLSRATVAMLLETAATSLRLMGGTVATKRTTNGATITETATQEIRPKYVAYHTAAGYQVAAIPVSPSSALSLTGMDQPWLLVWYGNQSHWVDSTLPLNYAVTGFSTAQGLPPRYAFQADAPVLMVFSSNPTSIIQTSGSGGFDLTWGGAAGKISLMPLYGRLRQLSSVTEGWSTGLPAALQTKIAAWWPRLCEFPASVAESHAYTSGTDTATITETITWNQVKSGGTKFAPLPPVLGIARGTALAGLSVSGTVVDGDVPTEYGPTQGIASVNSYTWSLSGLAASTVARPGLGNGAIPGRLQTRINDEVDKLIAQTHWQPWYIGARSPNPTPGGDVYFTNPTETLALASELVPLVTGARKTNLQAWIATERAAYPPETVYNLSATAGTPRGSFSTPGTHAIHWTNTYPWMVMTRQWLFAAWGLARYYQETATTPTGTVVTNLVNIIDSDMAEQDWATGHWFNAKGDRQTSVENANRHWAGLAGLAWMCAQVANGNEGLVRALLAKATITRVMMATLPRWQASVGLITTPQDLGSAATNKAWMPSRVTAWVGFPFTYDWDTSMDDPRQVVFLDQYQAYLEDSKYHMGWTQGGNTNFIPTYRWMPYQLAKLLMVATPGELEIHAAKHREVHTNWWAPFSEAVLGSESNIAQPMDSHGLLMIRAWIEGVSAATLEREAAYPWLDQGADLFASHKMVEAARAYAGSTPVTQPVLGTVTDNRASYTGSQIPRYSPLTVSVPVTGGLATIPWLMYDTSAPFASDGTVGRSVDMEISTDPSFPQNSSTKVAPLAYVENYSLTTAGTTDRFYPLGTSQYQGGYLPLATGTYYYRIKATEAGGVATSATFSFTVVAALAGNHGPVVRCAADTRYFEYHDGTPFSGVGMAFQPQNSNIDDPVGKHGPHMAALGTNKAKMVRLWASRWAIWGDYQPEWISLNRTSENYYNNPSANPSFPFPTGDVEYSAYLNNFTGPQIGFIRRPPAVKPNTTYRLTCKYAIDRPLVGPLVPGDAYGFGWKIGDVNNFPLNQVTYGGETTWVYNRPDKGTLVGGNASLDPGPTPAWPDWTTKVFGDYTTGASQTNLQYIVPVYQSVSAPPPIWIAEVYLQEVNFNGVPGALGPNIIGVHPSDFHKQINQRYAAGFDKMFSQAEAAGIVLKVVMLENNQYSTGTMGTDGKINLTPFNGSRFWGSTTLLRQRWWHKAVARYFVARWGYSPNVYWEFVNEGPQGDSNHFIAANLWSQGIKAFANYRLTSTSQDSGLSTTGYVQNAPDLDNADAHNYIWTGFTTTPTIGSPAGGTATIYSMPSDYYDVAGGAERMASQLGARRPYGVNRPTIRGETGLVQSSNTNNFLTGATNAALGIAFHKLMWAQIAPHGVIDHYWYTNEHIYDPTDGSPNNLSHMRAYESFIENFPLNNGRYVDAAAGSNNSNVRAWGQKDLAANRFHLWVDNKGANGNADDTAHNWRTVNAGLTPTARTATITVPGLGANVSGTLYKYDPYTETYDAGTALTIGTDGVATISVSGLSTDWAYYFDPLPAPGAVADVTASLVNLGNPVSTIAGYGKTIHALKVHEGRLYYGAGNASNSNRNPNTNGGVLKYWDPSLLVPAFVSTGFTPSEQQVQTFRVIGGNLVIPGIDSTADDTNEGWAKGVSGIFTQYNSIFANWSHNFDLLDFGGKLFAVGGVNGTASTVKIAAGGVGTSAGNWADSTVLLNDPFRVWSIFAANGKVYFCHSVDQQVNPNGAAIYEYVSGTTITATLKSAVVLKFADVFPSTSSVTYTDRNNSSQSVVSAKIYRPTNFASKVFYIGGEGVNDQQIDPYGLYSVTEGSAGTGIDTATFARVLHPRNSSIINPKSRDIWTDGTKLRVLWTYVDGTGAVWTSLVESANGSVWTELFIFTAGQTPAFSYEFLNSIHYFGLGTDRFATTDAAIQANVGEILSYSTGTTPTPGGAPTIQVAAGINSVTVSWDVPSGWATGITAYEIEQTNVTLGLVTTQSTPNVLVWPVTSLSSAYIYTFRVRAYSGAVVGGYSVASLEISPVALGGYLKDQILTWFKGTNADAAPATIYWSLHTGDPGKTGASEVSTSGTAYARRSMATSGFSAIADGTGTKRRITNAGAITYSVPTASWGTVTYAGAYDALTGGNFLGGGILAQSAAITVPQDAPKFNIGQLAVELD